MFNFLSKFSIRQQIIIGYIPIVCFLLLLSFSSFRNFNDFSENFQNFEIFTKNHSGFIETERDIMALQRNIVVYSYLGYEGVLKKIDFLHEKLERKFKLIQRIADQDPLMKDRLKRLLSHYKDYKKGLKIATEKKQLLQELSHSKIALIQKKNQETLRDITLYFSKKKDFSTLYLIEKLQRNLLEIKNNIESIKNAPDLLIISETKKKIETTKRNIDILKKNTKTKEVYILLKNVEQYNVHFKKIIIISRVYSHLINVVLPGKAAEIDKLAVELEALSLKNSQNTSKIIIETTKQSQNQFIFFILFAAILGFLSLTFIATGIANPVRRMTITFSKLASGASDVEIPAQKRQDEVGKMAQSAHEFKLMSHNLDLQTKELEEFTYRTYHDLRSPLISSISLLNITKQSLDQSHIDVAKRSIDLVQSSLIKLETLTQDILELAKTKKFDEETKEININILIEEAVEKFSNLENFNRIHFQKDLKFKDPIQTKKSRLVLIIDNLISNAIKYQDPKKQSSFINISTYEKEGYLFLEVNDNGLGIPQHYQKELFNMFKRFHPNVSFGSGLGLYMMKKSANIIGGHIIFEDKKGETTFKLSMPISNENKGEIKNENRIHNDHR